ncbi:MAG: glycosyltransferase [Deltaproteobacteria bacterium]|nr:MAG: glycosyltransferase [Deltaproteobacteria bacterium]
MIIMAPMTLSIVVPVYNAATTLAACLTALETQLRPGIEVIVVDDGSTDASAEVAERFAVRLLRERHRGDAVARNRGAKEARGKILLFLDADVVIPPGTLDRIVSAFQNPTLCALVGAYRPDTPARGTAARYKNFLHHHTHLNAPRNFPSFWTGLGAIRREVFERLGGFDPRFAPISDVHLGVRLTRAGGKIRLDPTVQVTHLKPLTWWGLLWMDYRDRAVPWTRIMLHERTWIRGLNTGLSQVGSLLSVWLLPGALWMGWRNEAPISPLLPLLFLSLFFLGNWRFLCAFHRRYGPLQTALAAILHAGSFLAQGIGLAHGTIAFLHDHLRRRSRAEDLRDKRNPDRRRGCRDAGRADSPRPSSPSRSNDPC